MLSTIAALALAGAAPSNDFRMLPGSPSLSLFHEPGTGPSVLYIHGSTFPTALSIAYRIEGKSWADDLHDRGLDVWSLDFPGYGSSQWPLAAATGSNTVPGRAADGARQIARAVDYVRSQTGHSRVSIIAHSWGTLPAGMFAAQNPGAVDKLVLFGPVAERKTHRAPPVSPDQLVSAADQWSSFQIGMPVGASSPISEATFRRWVEAYLETDRLSGTRSPRSVRVPSGPDADLAAAWSGHFPYDPSSISAPTLIVRGEWDPVARDADAAWLTKAMRGVPGGVRDVKLLSGAHRMHLEQNRQVLFDAVGEFLVGEKQ